MAAFCLFAQQCPVTADRRGVGLVVLKHPSVRLRPAQNPRFPNLAVSLAASTLIGNADLSIGCSLLRLESHAVKHSADGPLAGFQGGFGPSCDGCFEYFSAAIVPDGDVVSRLRKGGPLHSNPMGDEFSVVLRFLPGPALMSQDVVSRQLDGKVKEEPLHKSPNAPQPPAFLEKGGCNFKSCHTSGPVPYPDLSVLRGEICIVVEAGRQAAGQLWRNPQ
jgi:hypothetical protein